MNFQQAGGHGLLVKSHGEVVMKPTRSSEAWFYINAPPALRPFMPIFYMACPIIAGMLFSPEKLQTIMKKVYTDVVVMQSLNHTTDEFTLDVKIGSIHWRRDTSPGLIEAQIERNANSSTKTNGFRLDGAIQYGGYSFAKEDCRNFTVDQLNSAFMCFNTVTKNLLIGWIDSLVSVLEKMPIAIYGPSILITGTNKAPRFTLIDFTVHDISTINPDLIAGLKSFQTFLQSHIEFSEPPKITNDFLFLENESSEEAE